MGKLKKRYQFAFFYYYYYLLERRDKLGRSSITITSNIVFTVKTGNILFHRLCNLLTYAPYDNHFFSALGIYIYIYILNPFVKEGFTYLKWKTFFININEIYNIHVYTCMIIFTKKIVTTPSVSGLLTRKCLLDFDKTIF